MEITVKNFIFCDDVRVEVGRKFSLMGIYADKMRIRPNTAGIQKIRIPVSAFVRFQTHLNGKNQNYVFEIQIDFGMVNLAKIEGSINFGEDRFASLPIPRIEFDVLNSDVLTYHVLLKDKNDKIVLDHREELKVVLEAPEGVGA